MASVDSIRAIALCDSTHRLSNLNEQYAVCRQKARKDGHECKDSDDKTLYRILLLELHRISANRLLRHVWVD
jgi:hypothetical protein